MVKCTRSYLYGTEEIKENALSRWVKHYTGLSIPEVLQKCQRFIVDEQIAKDLKFREDTLKERYELTDNQKK
jgi:hypothetical protein